MFSGSVLIEVMIAIPCTVRVEPLFVEGTLDHQSAILMAA